MAATPNPVVDPIMEGLEVPPGVARNNSFVLVDPKDIDIVGISPTRHVKELPTSADTSICVDGSSSAEEMDVQEETPVQDDPPSQMEETPSTSASQESLAKTVATATDEGKSAKARLSASTGALIDPVAQASWTDLPSSWKTSMDAIRRLLEAYARCGFHCPVIGCSYRATTADRVVKQKPKTKGKPKGPVEDDTPPPFLRKNGVVIELPGALTQRLRVDGWREHWEFAHHPMDTAAVAICQMVTQAGKPCQLRLRALRPSDMARHYTNGKLHGLTKDDANVTSGLLIKQTNQRLGARMDSPSVTNIEWASWFAIGFEKRTGSRYEGPSFAKANPIAPPDSPPMTLVVSKHQGKKKQKSSSAPTPSTSSQRPPVKSEQVKSPRKRRRQDSDPDNTFLPVGSAQPCTYTDRHGKRVKASRASRQRSNKALRKAKETSGKVVTRWDDNKASLAALTKMEGGIRSALWAATRNITGGLKVVQTDANLSLNAKFERMKDIADAGILSLFRQSTKLSEIITKNGGTPQPHPLVERKAAPKQSQETPTLPPPTQEPSCARVSQHQYKPVVHTTTPAGASATATVPATRREEVVGMDTDSVATEPVAATPAYSQVLKSYAKPKVAATQSQSGLTSLGQVRALRHPPRRDSESELLSPVYEPSPSSSSEGARPKVRGSTARQPSHCTQPTERELAHRVACLHDSEYFSMREALHVLQQRLDAFARTSTLPDSIRGEFLDHVQGLEHAGDRDVH